MGMGTYWASATEPSSAKLSEQHPDAALFELIEHRFGQACTSLKAKRGAIICSQGKRLSCIYLLKEGEILLTRLSPDGRETLLSVLGPGDFFGESALLSGDDVTFSAHATKQSLLLQLPERHFKTLLKDPQACIEMLGIIARRCNDAWTQMEVLGCTHVRDKVRSGLLWLSGRIGVETGDGVRIDLNQTRLAQIVGCARETFSREVRELRRLRAVDVRHRNGRKSLYVTNPEGLN